MGVVGFVARRLLLLVPVVIGVTFLAFLISFVFVHDPTRAWAGIRSSEAARAALAARYHLSDPIWVQYYYYMANLVTGNWGVVPSSGRPVLNDIQFFLPATVELAIASLIITMVIGTPLGVLASLYHDRKLDHLIRFSYLTGYCSPPYLVALVCLFLFAYAFKIFPTQGELSLSLAPPVTITGMYIIDALLTANWPVFEDAVWHVILPASALSLTYLGIVTRVTRASMLEVLQKDFIRASYAKGLSSRTVILKHALKNSLISTVTVLGLLLGSLLGGTVVIETIFQWPGIGYYATQAILSFDFPAVIGTTLIFALAVVLANLAADILYAVLDPRIRI